MVTVHDTPGQAPTYDLFLPHATSASEPTGTRGAVSRAPARLRILLAEDEPLVQGAAVAMLESLGHQVTPCGDGRAAVEAFAERRRELDLVLLDMVMPQMSGSEVFDRIRAIDPKIRVLLSSGYTLDSETQGLLARGAAGFVQKPYRIDELARAIARALA
jgi:CheY-like chemotaxis protein